MYENVFYFHFSSFARKLKVAKRDFSSFRLFVIFLSKVNLLTFEDIFVDQGELEDCHCPDMMVWVSH
jgi:hypothetical protein